MGPMGLDAEEIWEMGPPGPPGTEGTSSGPSANVGTATVTFATRLLEQRATVTGQTSITATSRILLTIQSAGDDNVSAQEWCAPVVESLVAGTGFTILVKPKSGRFAGTVTVHWSWQ